MPTYYGRKYELLKLRHRLKEILLSVRIALKSKTLGKPNTKAPIYIAMVDGEAFHGGMCDRFKGIISLYAYCKHHQIPFRIKYTYPFKLEDYLSPNIYDWQLKEQEYTDNPIYCKILYMRGEHLAERLLKEKSKKQVHFYTNRDLLEHINDAFAEKERLNWGNLFCELFKPGIILQERMSSIKQELGLDKGYLAAVFRFQNLLGDFHEYKFKPISDNNEKEQLIEKCLNAIKKLQSEHKEKELLVTSDSVHFLKKVSSLKGVHIIPGTLVHIDGNKHNLPTKNDSFEIYLKSFLDFYMLSEAQKVFRIGTPYMFPSEFPVYAAKVHNIPFESIII